MAVARIAAAMSGVLAVVEVFVVAIIAISLLEALILVFVAKRAYDWRSSLASVAILLGRNVTDLTPIALAIPAGYWLYRHRLFEPGAMGLWSWVVLFVALEFLYYWWHRLSHRSRWFWTHHAVHHSPSDLTLAVAYRTGWTARFTGSYAIFAPLCLLGFTPELVYAAYTGVLAYQFWLHTDWIPRLGPLEGILNTPSAHRVHHAVNGDYLDSNYGGVLLVFDRLFATYRREREDLPCRYGLVEPLRTYNPLAIAFHQFGPLVRDLKSARGVREVAGYLFGPPGWRPSA